MNQPNTEIAHRRAPTKTNREPDHSAAPVLSKDGLNGWPTEEHPEPWKVARERGTLVGSKQTRHPQPPGEAPKKTGNAGKSESLAEYRAMLEECKEFCRIYGVRMAVKLPGKNARFVSPSCKEKGCKVGNFESLEKFIEHMAAVHGTPEAELAWAERAANVSL